MKMTNEMNEKEDQNIKNEIESNFSQNENNNEEIRREKQYNLTYNNSKSKKNFNQNNPSYMLYNTSYSNKNKLPPIYPSYSTTSNFLKTTSTNFNSTNSNFKTFLSNNNNNLANFTEEEIRNNTKDFLKKELIFSKKEMNKTNKELHDIKIQFGKLFEENKYNKNLIESVLGINPNKNYTNAEVKDKIENCILSDEEVKLVKEAYKIICLKEEIEEIKKDCLLKKKELLYLKNNVKIANNNFLKNDYMKKEEEKRKLIRYVKRLEKKK